ncbi:MAG TPA: hypothetical protein VN280_22420 [Variovorax sp.]|nr:hypothetical protein [Variovorax sp.]
MIALALLYRFSRTTGRALADAALFALFCFGLLLAWVWRWA